MSAKTINKFAIEYDDSKNSEGDIFISIKEWANKKGHFAKWFHFEGGPLDGRKTVVIYTQEDSYRLDSLVDKEQGYNYSRTREDENNIFYSQMVV